tara:strand:+ start:245 stop:757 length:513 start_codon:yes stop_codon:yes gene_type:complete
MAKHGYTVSWGFFSGTCQGSDALPFEQDCSLVAEAIRGSEVRRDYLAKRVSELRADTRPAKAHATFWVRGKGYQSAWVPTDAIVVAEPGQHSGQWVAPVTGDCGTVYEAAFGYKNHTYGSTTAVEAAYEANVRLAEDIERKDLASAQQYIAWQTSRLAGWTIQPLRAAGK